MNDMINASNPKAIVSRRAPMGLLSAALLLVGGLAMVEPAVAAASPDASITTVDGPPTAFIQEGFPAAPGRMVKLVPEADWPEYNYYGNYIAGSVYSSPEGSLDYLDQSPPPTEQLEVTMAGRAGTYALGLLHGDGTVEVRGHTVDHDVLVNPEGYAALVSNDRGDFFGLRSGDGAIDTNTIYEEQEPPSGRYIGLSAGDRVLALRDDGTVWSSSTDDVCGLVPDAPHGLTYTAVSTDGPAWMALRSDGALVSCGYGDAGEVDIHHAPQGQTYVGMNAGQTLDAPYGLAVTSAGQIREFPGAAVVAVQPPAGRTVISLAAGISSRAAVLDDGSLLTWGEDLRVPRTADGAARFNSVNVGSDGAIYALWDSDLLTVETTVLSATPAEPVADRAIVDQTTLTVTLGGDYVPEGVLCLDPTNVYADLGSSDGPYASSSPGEAMCPLKVTPDKRTYQITGWFDRWGVDVHPADYNIRVAYVSPLARVSYDDITVPSAPQKATIARVTGPMEWVYQDSRPTMTVKVLPESPVGTAVSFGGEVDLVVNCPERTVLAEAYNDLSTGSQVTLYTTTRCPPGTYDLTAVYTPPGGSRWAASESAIGSLRILPRDSLPVAERELGWVVGKNKILDVDLQNPNASGIVHAIWNGNEVAAGVLASGRISLQVPGSVLTAGQGTIELRYEGDSKVVAKTWSREVVVAPGEFSAPRPTISGSVRVGGLLTSSVGTWSPVPSAVRYVWKANGTVLQTGTSKTFTVPLSALGKRVVVEVTGTRAGYADKTVVSTPTVNVAGVFTAASPTISGVLRVGRTLTASPGTWKPVAPSSFVYTWKIGGVTYKTSTSSKLKVPASARGKRITVTVTGTRSGFTALRRTSSATELIKAGVFTAPRPQILGTAKVGRTLTAVRGKWTPDGPTQVTYVWKVNGTTYKRSTSSRFTIPRAARGKRITVTVIGSRPGYLTKTVTSAATAAVRG